jgi:uncharacterized protein (DUF3084 family)
MSAFIRGRQQWVTLQAHLQAIQIEREKFAEERDRRYTEVKNAEEKALKIKEEADKVALDLARQIQTYKDLVHNGLLDQLTQERGQYSNKGDLVVLSEKMEASLKPLVAFMAGSRGGSDLWAKLAIGLGLIMTGIGLFFK